MGLYKQILMILFYNKFNGVRLILEAQPQICSSIISTSTITDNIERVRRMIADDRRQYLRIIAEE